MFYPMPIPNACSRMIIVTLLLYLSSCTRTHNEKKSATEVSSIAIAVKSFCMEYGYSPCTTNTDYSNPMVDILPILMAMTNVPCVYELNPKGIPFLEVSAYRIRDGQIIDPWGNPYHIIIAQNGAQTTKVGSDIVNAPVAVWSDGRNRKDQVGKGDDINSW